MKNEVRKVIRREKIIAIMRNVETRECVETAKVSIPGAMTPTEVLEAYRAIR